MCKCYRLKQAMFQAFCLLCLILFVLPLLADVADGRRALLIKNAILVDRRERDKHQTVNLLINDGILKMVTVGTAPDKLLDMVVDARGGFLLGALEVGSPASMMIMDQDPLENLDVLMDTKTHAVFVMRGGRIILNWLLPPLPEEPKAEEEKKVGWLAYSPPPFVLPASYHNSNRWNQFETEYVNGIFIGALMLDRVDWTSQSDGSKDQVGDLSEYDGGEIRALRVGMVGTFNFDDPWVYTCFIATHAFDQGFDSDDYDSLVLFDLRLDIPLPKDLSLSIGKQKEPISMERLMPLTDVPMQERSAISDSMLPSRNIGMVLSGASFGERLSWATGLFNPWLDEDGDLSENPTQIIGRGTILPLVSSDESSILHLGVGVRYADVKSDVRYKSTPEVHQSSVFIDTGEIIADDSLISDFEAAWRWGPFLLNGEYVINQVNAPSANDPSFSGYHITASYVLTGEMREYNKRRGIFRPVPVANPVSTDGWGSWEIATRFSSIDLQDESIEGGNMDVYSLGLNWKLSPLASVSMNYRHIELEQDGTTEGSDALMMRVTLMME